VIAAKELPNLISEASMNLIEKISSLPFSFTSLKTSA
jgi:hypothetical protein